MNLALFVNAFGERAKGRCPGVWIDLSPTLARKALRRIHTVRCAEANDDELIESRFISREATIFNPWLRADCLALVGLPKGTGTFVATWELSVTVLELAAQLPN